MKFFWLKFELKCFSSLGKSNADFRNSPAASCPKINFFQKNVPKKSKNFCQFLDKIISYFLS